MWLGTRAEIHKQLMDEGFTTRGTSSEGRGYAIYDHPDGTRIDIRPDGEVITTQRGSHDRFKFGSSEPIPPGVGVHNTGQFVEPLQPGVLRPSPIKTKNPLNSSGPPINHVPKEFFYSIPYISPAVPLSPNLINRAGRYLEELEDVREYYQSILDSGLSLDTSLLQDNLDSIAKEIERIKELVA